MIKGFTNKKTMLFAMLFIIIAIFVVILINNPNITGFAIFDNTQGNFVEKTIDIEVWAGSYIKLEVQEDSVLARVYLDNGTLIEDQELVLYLEDFQTANPTNEFLLNLSEVSPGTYNLKVESQGSSIQYVNSTNLKAQVEITEINSTKKITIVEEVEMPDDIGDILGNETELLGLNLTFSNETVNLTFSNETIFNETEINANVSLVDLSNYNCQEFEEIVLWSSGFTRKPQDSTNYQTWHPEYGCSDINVSECFVSDIEIDSRLISIGPETEAEKNESIGYVQISELSNCNAPQSGKYLHYLAYDRTQGEDVRKERYCGGKKNVECESEISEYLGELKSCYGIKAKASQNMIVDVFSVKYNLCMGDLNE